MPAEIYFSRCSWKFISQGLARFLKFISLSVGIGDRVRFWEDHWRGDAPFCSLFLYLYRLSLSHNTSISAMFSLNSQFVGWDFKFFRGLNERECSEFASLMVILESFSLRLFIPDRRIWIANPFGVFSCKSSFEKLIECPDTPFSHLVLIWKASVPLKVKGFTWTVVHKGINTNDRFQKRRPSLYACS